MTAFLALLLWPVVSIYLFRKLSLTRAIIMTIMLGYLLLPAKTGIDPPLLPEFDKDSIPAIMATLLAWLHQRRTERVSRLEVRNRGPVEQRAAPEGADASGRFRRAPRPAMAKLFRIVVILLLMVPVLTFLNNREPLIYGPRYLQAIRPYDVFSMLLTSIMMLLPFWVARKHLVSDEGRRDLVWAFAICGLAYSLPVLWEARMSPQLHRTIYGFFQHSWIQHVRGGHFRPIVFLDHGLRVGIFLAMSVMACATMARTAETGKLRLRWLMATFYLFGVLFLSRNFGALTLATFFLPVVLLTGRRMQLLFAAMIGATVLIYPALRGADMIPTERVVSWAESVDPERAASLAYRLRNEDMLLDKANRKPLTGWGLWGRNQTFNSETGGNTSVTDGIWVIQIGVSGWIGYITIFSMLCLPLIVLGRRRAAPAGDLVSTGLGMVLAINLLDLIPNSSLVPLTWMLAGALWGMGEQVAREAPGAARKVVQDLRRGPRERVSPTPRGRDKRRPDLPKQRPSIS